LPSGPGYGGRAILIFVIVLGLTGLLAGACTIPEETRTPAESKSAPAGPSTALETAPSHLLSSLRVAGDSCYVFLLPDENSRHFGPLVKGETLKWLDAQGSWVRVWIPRLRVSGWVHGNLVQEAPESGATSERVPAHLMSTVTVIVRKANIREAPTTEAEIIRVARRNQQYWLLKKERGWYQVWLTDLKRKGWISGKVAARLRKE
jgi:hypothetical protein